MKVTTLVLAAFLGTACAAHAGKVSKLLAQVNQDECEFPTASAGAPEIDEAALDVDLSWCDCDVDLPTLSNGVQANTALQASVN